MRADSATARHRAEAAPYATSVSLHALMLLLAMSAFGPKQTSLVAPHMPAFGGKADMTFCGNPLSRSLSGVKRTCLIAAQMSAFDPKRTFVAPFREFLMLHDVASRVSENEVSFCSCP